MPADKPGDPLDRMHPASAGDRPAAAREFGEALRLSSRCRTCAPA